MKRTRKRFGTFLVERGVVTPAQVEEALVRQEQMRPSKSIVALRLGMLTISQAKAVTARMQLLRCEFEAAVLAMRLVSLPDLSRITEERAKYDPRLGVVLVMMGAVEADALYMLLQRFEQERKARDRSWSRFKAVRVDDLPASA